MGSRSATLPPARLPDKAVRQQLSRILASKTFSQVERLKRFVSFIVGETVSGRGGDLKEYVIGVQVFGKEPSFDPRTDPIVRVQARRLRTRLARYYRDEGNNDELIIDLPKGGYAPVFKARDEAPSSKRSLTATLAGRNTVAVRPLADDSPGGSLDYFCRGLRDEIVHALTSIKALRVLAVRSGDTPDDLFESDPGDAALVITGGVRSARERLRVTIHLVDGASGFYLWSESIDVDVADPLSGQEAIAKLVADKVAPEVDAEGAPGARRQSDNLAARNLYLQGRYHLNQRTEDSLHKAVEFFEKAIIEDTQFSLAHSGLADAHGLLAHYGVLGPADVWARAASSAASAVMLDGHSAEAHTSLAHVRATQDWDFASAEHLFQKAIQLNPRYSTARHWHAMSCLVPMARLDEALEQILIAQSLDPVSAIIARDVAVIQYYRRDFDAALEQCDHTIELNPHFAPAYLTLGFIQEQRKELDEAAAAFRRAVDLAPNSLRMQSALARTLALSGRPERAVDTLRTLEQLAAQRYVSPVEFMTTAFAAGDRDAGYRWLNKACDDRCFEMLTLKADPRFDPISDDPRFNAVTGRVGLG
ncbi:MAG TPA: tetratricopeptide repeat protein [Vicinamibacterales bacterium]|nr:tetratricopeptide repeat protein [Vicinamibacterales bacterium]